MALKELYQAYVGDNDLWMKVAGACMIAAMDIAEESPATPNHANRIVWAVSVRDNAKAMAKSMLVKILQDATIAADVTAATDAQIQTVVNGLINDFATG